MKVEEIDDAVRQLGKVRKKNPGNMLMDHQKPDNSLEMNFIITHML